MKVFRYLSALGLAVILLFLAMPTLAMPQMPHQFYGRVVVNGQPAATGMVVSVRIGGAEYISTTTDAQGRYGYAPFYLMMPTDDIDTTPKEGGNPGETLQFFVAGIPAATAKFASGQVTNLELSVATLPPTVGTEPATSVSATSATLNGSLGTKGTSALVSAYFEYGPTTAYGSQTTARSMFNAGSFSVSLTGLTPGTLYHYRAKASGSVHGQADGADLTFTILPLPGQSVEAPSVTPSPTPTPTASPTPSPVPVPPPPARTPSPTPEPVIEPEAAPEVERPIETPTPSPAPKATPVAASVPAPITPPPPVMSPRTSAPSTTRPPLPERAVASPGPSSSVWSLIGQLSLASGIGLGSYLILKRRQRSKSGRNKPLPPLHIEAAKLNQEIGASCRHVLAAPGASPDQAYLLRKYYLLMQVSHLMNLHSNWVKGRAIKLDPEELERYHELLGVLRRMMPPPGDKPAS